MQKFPWWDFRPAHQELLVEQPGDKVFNHFISVVKTGDYKTVLAYVPVKSTFKLYNKLNIQYQMQWFNPAENTYSKVSAAPGGLMLEFTSPEEGDRVLILTKK